MGPDNLHFYKCPGDNNLGTARSAAFRQWFSPQATLELSRGAFVVFFFF